MASDIQVSASISLRACQWAYSEICYHSINSYYTLSDTEKSDLIVSSLTSREVAMATILEKRTEVTVKWRPTIDKLLNLRQKTSCTIEMYST